MRAGIIQQKDKTSGDSLSQILDESMYYDSDNEDEYDNYRENESF